MPTVTDPARELADICVKLQTQSNKPGDQFLAAQFGVEPWSTEFFQIVFCISQRADFLISLLDEIDIDDDYRTEHIGQIKQIQQAFGQNGLQNHWQHAATHFLSPANVNPLKGMSALIRPLCSYPKLSTDDRDELIATVDELLGWLNEHQLVEQDFIRQAIIDGLIQFRFRLERIEWLGWGYSLTSLKDVVSAYMILERGGPDPNVDPVAVAILEKTAGWVKTVFGKVGIVREGMGDLAFMVLAYQEAVKVAHGSSPITGLLTFAG